MNFRNLLLYFIIGVFLSCGGQDKKVDFENMSESDKISYLNAKIRKEPNDADLFFKRAKVLYEKGEYADALMDIQRAVTLNGKVAEYHVLQADILFSQQESALAFSSLQTAKEVDGKCIEAYLKTAELSLYLRDYENTMFNVKQAILLDKLNPTAYFLRGWALKEQGDTINAVKDYQKAIELKSDYEQAYEELGLLYAIKGDALAVEYLNSTININPNNYSAMYVLALFYQEHNAIAQALETYQKLLEIKPDHADALHNVGYINLVEKQDCDIAIECFNSAIKVDSLFWQAYLSRAEAYEKKGDMAKAKADFQKAEEIKGKM
ncbi:MAG: tetratricopeptide repeat protein [Bacteroidales bacterium]|nr:tetratricopeptide repeat protein [Bacteroidales bacterium]